MFFSEINWNSRIEKASLDGLNRVVIVYRGLIKVFSLTVDTVNNKLYWADHDRQTLESCDYDGSNRRVIKRTNSMPMRSLTYHQVKVYYFLHCKKKITCLEVSRHIHVCPRNLSFGFQDVKVERFKSIIYTGGKGTNDLR